MEEKTGPSNTMLAGIIIVILVVAGGFLLLKNKNKQKSPTVTNEEQVTEIPQTTTEPTVEPTTKETPKVTEATKKKETPTPAPTKKTEVKETTMKVVLDSDVASKSTQKGTATLTEVNGKVRVTLALTGGDYSSPQPAHIHAGSCPKPDKVVYPLQDVVDGKSDTTLDVSMADLKKQEPLAINVHKSKTDINVYAACGNIK